MITDLARETNKQYGAYLVIAWENTSDYEREESLRCDEVRYVTVRRSTPKIFTCNTVEELGKVLADCKAKQFHPVDSFKSTKVMLKQTITLDVEE